MNMYRSCYQTLYEQKEFHSDSSFFSISMEIARAADGSYAYAVILDEPRTAMHDIRALVIEDDIPYDQETKMMPSAGIFDEPCSMIPNQVNRSAGYVRGIALSGNTDHSPVSLRVLVEWKSESAGSMQREYIERRLNAEDGEESSNDAS